MYIKKTRHKQKDGSIKTQIQIVESYRPAKGANPKQRIIKDLGYLEDKDDSEAFLNELKKQIKKEKQDDLIFPIRIDPNRKIFDPDNRNYKYGPFLMEGIYDSLKLPSFIRDIRKSKARYDLNAILSYLIAMRIVFPDSKRSSFMDHRHIYGMDSSFSLNDIYRSLDELCDLRVEIQEYLHDYIDEGLSCDNSFVYLDTTNFYFETDYPRSEDGLRQRGVSKEHRVDPIVQLGLVLNANGFPIAHECFKGNTSDSLILKPMIEMVLKRNRIPEKIIVVADKGLNSSDNIDYLVNNGHGFLFSQIVKGKKGKRYQEKMFDESGYTVNGSGTYKYKIFIEEYDGRDSNGKKIKRQRKVLIYWDKANAERDKNRRDAKVLRAKKSLNNQVYDISHGKDKYVKLTPYEKESGEIKDIKTNAAIDEEKILEEEKYDGYSCLITSELDYDERRMRSVYHNLWVIEASFKVEKSDLDSRPVFVWTDDHIRGHFVICHIALFIVRLIQWAMNQDAVSAERIQRVLANCILDMPAKGVLHLQEVSGKVEFDNYIDEKGYRTYTTKETDDDEVALDFRLLLRTLNLEIDKAYIRQEVFNSKKKKIAITLQPRP